ncbi:myoferlin-like [Hemitrygon akajei]|uniref:myoferlin-like n=1 Tax=Hemitrygon akajei TaxID=2704970 RepID=UPI003BF9ABE0
MERAGKTEQPPSVTNITGVQEPAARPQSLPPEQDAVKGTSKFSRNSNKPEDFQVRIRIIEGRHLQGLNIRPVVKVYVGDSTFRTRIRRGNNPVFDEIFFQNFHKTPSEVFNTSIHIQVLNSHSLRSDSMIGIFKLDIGSIYDFPGHAVLRKWLLLYEVDGAHSMSRGYLKVSIIVLAAGDEAPIDKKGTNEDDDVESNLLQPASILSRWVTFIVKIYRAEDLSHMTRGLMTNLKHMFRVDTDKKDDVDSFLEVSFAGSKVATKVVENQINPEWNQMIYLRSRFPSLCENIRFTVYDRKSATKSKHLGTTYLNISAISSMGQGGEDENSGGFLPAFGPCFLNLYGSPREGLDGTDKDDEFNRGKEEGVSYRGRILIELITRIEEHSGNKIDKLPSDDSLIVQRYLRRRRYSLCVVFYSATQLQDTKEPIQFEVSMGNYGNRFDKSCKLHASTTQYSQPVFDGNYYYYLLWCDTKPVAALTSYWENIDHRLNRLNSLLKIVDKLKASLEDIKQTMPSEGARLTGMWMKMLDRVVKDCSRPLPVLTKLPHVTVLDRYLYNQQVTTLKKIRKSAEKLRDQKIDAQDKLPEVEDWIEKLTSVAKEPQNSLPDIIIWMMCGEKRVACARIKAQSVLFSSDSRKSCGKFCGKWQTVFLKHPLDKTHEMRIIAQLRLWIWLGLSSDEEEFEKLVDGKFMVAAERYENQAKVMGHWGTSGLLQHPIYSDAMGKMRLSKKDFYPLKGWEWDGKWTVDPEQCLLFDPDAGHTEFVDDVYENENHLAGGEWVPAFEHYTDVKEEFDSDGWEYAPLFGWKFHVKQKKGDTYRRRRWRRKMIPKEQVGPASIFRLEGSLCRKNSVEEDDFAIKEKPNVNHNLYGLTAPFISCLLDYPYIQMSFLYQSKMTEVIKGTVNPTWDQTLIIEDIEIYGNFKEIVENPPCVMLEMFDSNHVEEDQDLPPWPPRKDSRTYMVPLGIRPQLQMTMIESSDEDGEKLNQEATEGVLIWDSSGDLPILQTVVVVNISYFSSIFRKHSPIISVQALVSASKNIFHKSNVIIYFHFDFLKEDDSIDWWCKFYASSGEHNEYSDYLLQGYDTIKVYPCALEDVPQFKGLQDFCNTFQLYRGKAYGSTEDPLVVGEFKGSFRIYPLPEDPMKPLPPPQFRQLPSSEPQDCLVRVYIIRALSLQPKDRNAMCDTYIKISLGKVLIDDREHYVPNTLNPVFGRMFQLYATIPLNKDLKVEVYDYDIVTQDDKIGETIIDLENRFLSRFGAHCGLPRTYCTGGPTQWRDQVKPTERLINLCKLKNYALPVFHNGGQKISIGDEIFLLEEFEVKKVPYAFPGPPEERLALHVLRLQNLVPEHVETRTLFNSTQPGIEQGKIQMWIDIFPKNLGPPGPPFNITPRSPTRYILRCIVWNTNDVILQETSVMGEKMSDIYVKGWMIGLEDNTQKTDVHFRSLDGEGSFNWRFIFPFEYIEVERVLVISRKNYIWNLDEVEVKMPPKLIIQLWDNDKFSFDDYLGFLELNMNAFRSPTKWSDRCTLSRFFKEEGSSSDNLQKLVSLFKQRRVKGWWPCITYQEGKPVLTGKVELTLELVTELEAEERPAGKGREEPNMNPKLEPPNRPDTSFLWFHSPLKGLKYIVWRKYKRWVVCVLLLVVPVIFLLSILNAIPVSIRCYLKCKAVA